MPKLLLGSLITLGLSSCSHTPPATWQRAAVTTYIKQLLPVPDSYQPLHWGKLVVWRVGSVAKADLPLAQQELQGVAVELAQDSAGYALVARTATQFGTSAADVALVKQRYLKGVRYRDSTRVKFQQLVASQRDTTLAFYRLTHTYRFQNEQGQWQRDSAEFNIGKQGQVVLLHFHHISSPASLPQVDSLSPPPPDLQSLKSIQYY
ncbi:MAG: hypothetical protein ACRYG7_17615 [Janthinobacterium lividum]